jgi:predicted DNA-binding transcriptional regulator YafY
MGGTKYQKARIEIVDRELSKKDRVKTKDLLRIIEADLGLQFSIRTIQKDIELMKEEPPIGYSAPIEKDTRQKAYYYSEPFTIRAFGLKEEHINALLFYSRTLNQYHDYKIFNDISEAIEKVLDNFKIRPELKNLVKSRVIVQTEKAPPIKGHEHIQKITQALEENRKLVFDYTPFGKETSKRILAPYLLKEDKHLWYIIGMLDGKDFPTTFAVDRITNLQISEETFPQVDFDAENYFKYSFGVTVFECDPLEVILSFTPFQGNYIKALPIHETQKVLVDNDKEFRISLQVKPSYEFYSKILSYGSSVKVIAPEQIVTEVQKEVKATLNSYK